MYFDTYLEYKDSVMKDQIENEMRRHQNIALDAISRIAHFEKEVLMRILAYSYSEEHEDAMKLAQTLNLGKLEFFSILDDYDSFKELYLKDQEKQYEQEMAQNF